MNEFKEIVSNCCMGDNIVFFKKIYKKVWSFKIKLYIYTIIKNKQYAIQI